MGHSAIGCASKPFGVGASPRRFALYYDLDDARAHADEERIGVTNFYEGIE